MSTIAFKKTTFDAASQRDKTIFKLGASLLGIGFPALYTDPSTGVLWYVSADPRVDLKLVAVMACLIAGIASNTTYTLPTSEGTLDVSKLRSDIDQWVRSRVVLPKDIAYTEEGNSFAETIAAQSPKPPDVFRAWDAVPANWIPFSSEE
jgi:hypothetical protein